MSDDKEPQGPSNPFIRFKNHVNARIGTGVSVLTRTTDEPHKSLPTTQPASHDQQDRAAASSPWPNRNHGPGTLSAQSGALKFWDAWCLYDQYSPHNLQHLPQPSPNDLPPALDPKHFGFREAFEDLMSLSHPFPGQLMDLETRARLKRSPSGRLVPPETPSAWVRRLYGNAMLPPPFIWEQPSLAGYIPRPWVARQGEQPAGGLRHAWEALEAEHRAQHDDNTVAEVARAYLEAMRRMDEGVDESFSKLEEIAGRELVELMRAGRTLADKAAEAFSGEASGRHNSSSNGAEAVDGAKPRSLSEKDQPDTEEDLFEMIESATAAADKLWSSFDLSRAHDRARQMPPRAERTIRDAPPVKETVEYDPSGGKTIRTSSEHVDAFGFIHSSTEVRRLNAKGETVNYDTRYSVRSSSDGPQGNRPRQEQYHPRCDAPASALMTPGQYSAFARKSSDEQLLQEQHKRFRAQTDAEEVASSGDADGRPHLQAYEKHFRVLEEDRKERLRRAREEEAATGPAPEKPQENVSSKSSGWFWR